MEQVDCIVVGAGVVGLAVAVTLARCGREVIVLETADAIGTGTSSRNSEVIHAGIYYPQGSLKASLCVRGRSMLLDFCASHQVEHRLCGKLIVATSSKQLAELATIRRKAEGNGVPSLQWLTRNEVERLEPALHCEAALLSPGTGIIDSHGLMLALQGELECHGGLVALNTAVMRAQCLRDGIEITTRDGTVLRANTVVNAAGLGAIALAHRFEGLDARHIPQAWYAKGHYFSLSGRSPFSHLVYPVPQEGGLGVHLTLDLAGQARFGPDVQWVDAPDDLAVDERRGDCFYEAVRAYWPELRDGALSPAYAGIRPKISGPDMPAADFMIQGPATHGIAGLVNLFGIESPGLTSALAIGEHVASLVAAAP